MKSSIVIFVTMILFMLTSALIATEVTSNSIEFEIKKCSK